MYQFLDLGMMATDVYQEVLERVQQGEKFLDLGCCFGQEIRQLVLDGAPSANTYGSDLWGDFLTISYELFKDKDRLQTTFVAADIFDDASPLTELAGRMNIIHAAAFFHLFGLEDQERIGVRIVQLLAPQPGSLIIGRQTGGENPGEYSRANDKGGRASFRHNAQSWEDLWRRVGEKTGSRWSVEADLGAPEFTLFDPKGKSTAIRNKLGSKGLRFTIRRL
jgi:SAM-dependent methyltransferase